MKKIWIFDKYYIYYCTDSLFILLILFLLILKYFLLHISYLICKSTEARKKISNWHFSNFLSFLSTCLFRAKFYLWLFDRFQIKWKILKNKTRASGIFSHSTYKNENTLKWNISTLNHFSSFHRYQFQTNRLVSLFNSKRKFFYSFGLIRNSSQRIA
jgi:hypothetical protein